tara:strand:+ start:329 stop:520 length:192 start_codon:yes stop_codon:yes gene_type:complete
MDKDNIKTVKKLPPAMSGEDTTIVRVTLQDDAWWDVPMVNDNSDYQAVQAWAAVDGNTIAEAD